MDRLLANPIGLNKLVSSEQSHETVIEKFKKIIFRIILDRLVLQHQILRYPSCQ
jgi:hypothetical protein